jgi:hypothetical protein
LHASEVLRAQQRIEEIGEKSEGREAADDVEKIHGFFSTRTQRATKPTIVAVNARIKAQYTKSIARSPIEETRA